jgi:hypothetical protein
MAGGGGNSSEDENYWPGFVDALTVMTMVLTFVMMVLGLVVFSLSQNTSRAQLDRIASAAKIDVSPSTPVEQVHRLIVDALARRGGGPEDAPKDASNQGGGLIPSPPRDAAAMRPARDPARGEVDAIDVASGARPSESRIASLADTPVVAQGLRRTERAEAEFTVIFQPRSFRLDDPARAEVDAFARAIDRAGAFEIRAFASTGDGAVSEARRVAYYRAMVLRQRLVDAGVPAARIRVRVDDQGRPVDAEAVRIFMH